MNKRLLAVAIAGALGAPGLVGIGRPPSLVAGRGLGGWSERNNPPQRVQVLSGREAKADRLKRKGWAEKPCDAPRGWFWKRDHGGKRLHRLYRNPVSEGRTIYDQNNDRYIVESGHGYRKPTYLNPDEHKARQDGRYF